ncbi:apolipoprotein N-acyltransferase [Actinobaculum suis]|nr:apolipoprotein N-acyltransferase [Actinobaculum suis]OCA94058.1 apolipoprotein N-acyltransferase [Actinobaculum suis]
MNRKSGTRNNRARQGARKQSARQQPARQKTARQKSAPQKPTRQKPAPQKPAPRKPAANSTHSAGRAGRGGFSGLARFLARLAGAIGAGLLLYASFAPLAWGPAAIFGIALLAGVVAGRSLPAAWGWGYVAGLAFFLPLLSWTAISTGERLPHIALAAAEALFIAPAALGWRMLEGSLRASRATNRNPNHNTNRKVFNRRPANRQASKRNVAGNNPAPQQEGILAEIKPAVVFAAGGAILWVAWEQLRGQWPFGGLPWGTLAFSQTQTPLLRLAHIGSTPLVSFAVVCSGLFLYWAARCLRRGRGLGGVLAILSSLAIFVAPIAVPVSSAASENLRIGFAQGEVAPASQPLDGRERALRVTQNLARATANSIDPGSIDLMLWPESASDLDARQDAEARAIVTAAGTRLGVPLLFGTQEYWDDPAATDGFSVRRRTNDYVVWTPEEGVSASYSKQHPVPFGEYIPYRDFFRKFSAAVDLVGTDMVPGQTPAYVDVPVAGRTVRIATPICFEVAYGEISAAAVRDGAQLLVVPTNNASFGNSAESRQQFEMTVFRAVELGRTAIQVSTVGVSGVVEPDGVVHHTTDTWTEEAQQATVGLRTHVTFAARFSVWIRAGVYLLGGVIFVVAWGRYRHGRARPSSQQ